MIIYLAGFMSADKKTRDWREEATIKFNLLGIHTLDPFRGKQEVSHDGLKCSHPTELLTARDISDIKHCDAMVLYTLGVDALPRQSIGTWSEFGFAAIGLGLPVIVVADSDSVIKHPFIERWAAQVVGTLDEAVASVAWLR